MVKEPLHGLQFSWKIIERTMMIHNFFNIQHTYVIFVNHPNQDNPFFCSSFLLFFLFNQLPLPPPPPNKQHHLFRKVSLDLVKEMKLFPKVPMEISLSKDVFIIKFDEFTWVLAM